MLQTALLLGATNDSRTHNDIEDMLAFESQLAKVIEHSSNRYVSINKIFLYSNLQLSTPPEDRRDAKVWYNRMTFKDFNKLTSNRVDWLQLTNGIYNALNSSMRLNWKELVIVGDIPYYKGVAKLLDRTTNRVIANYFGWRIAMNFGSYTVQKFRDIAFEFNKVSSGVQKLSEYWKPCASYVSNALQYAVSRKYVEENFTPKDKEEVRILFVQKLHFENVNHWSQQ
jgi:predicted metalloendopeptidase